MAYKKPDVEVYQQFKNLNPALARSILQACPVGPAYQLLTNEQLGAYDGSYTALPTPASLLSTSEVDETTIRISVTNYAGINEIPKSTIRLQSNAGRWNHTTLRFSDLNANLTDVKASTVEGKFDGDHLRILYGPKAGFYEVLEVIDQHTLRLSGTLGAADLTGLDYVISSYGFWFSQNEINMSPGLTSSGIVKMTCRALRLDQLDRVVVAASVNDLETIFGVGSVVPENPLPYAMSKVLSVLGQTDVAFGLMTGGNTATHYAAALEALEVEEIYSIIPLSQDPIVHQLCAAHCDVMSAPLEKMERRCYINTDRFLNVVKHGYYGIKDPITGILGRASCDLTHTGMPMGDESQILNVVVPVDGTLTALPVDTDTVVAYMRTAGVTATFKYSLTGDADPSLNTATFDQNGRAVIAAPTGKKILDVTYNATVGTPVLTVYSVRHIDTPDEAVFHYPVVMNPGVQMFDPYINVPVDSDYRGIRIRHYDLSAPEADVLVGSLPEGMSVEIRYGLDSKVTVDTCGTFPLSHALTSIYITNDKGAADVDNHLIEIEIVPNVGTYAVNRVKDSLATFLSSKVAPNDEVWIGTGVNAGVYTVKQIVSETEIVINDFFPSEALKVPYVIQTPTVKDKNVLASWYAQISSSMANRRVTHVYAPYVGVQDADGNTVVVPGYYLACVYAGLRQSTAPFQGFTNKPIPGFNRVFFTNDLFTERQLDIIAAGGASIIVQPKQVGTLSCRHQLTTDMTAIETREESCCSNLDYMAKMGRSTFRPLIGKFNVVPQTMHIFFSTANALAQRWLEDGNALLAQISGIYVDPAAPDSVVICYDPLQIPFPLNNVKLIFVV